MNIPLLVTGIVLAVVGDIWILIIAWKLDNKDSDLLNSWAFIHAVLFIAVGIISILLAQVKA